MVSFTDKLKYSLNSQKPLSLMLSHVNDSGFWLFKEYFNLSVKDTISSWTVMETTVGVMGLLGVLVLDIFI